MNVVFRADASLHIGTGHVMRCLTLAEALAAQGAACRFICREHAGNLIELIRTKGYICHALPSVALPEVALNAPEPANEKALSHAHWLGATQQQDAEACARLLSEIQPDWLVVDHYALDARWEHDLKPHYGRLMVIDDLADRPHRCDLLLDQTFGRASEDYRPWVPTDCRLLCGSQYALLRPEFAALRRYSLQRRSPPELRRLLITMGGVDKGNATSQVLEALRSCPLPADCKVTIVMGATAPWLADVERIAQGFPWPTQVKVGVSDMAQLMADSDLVIGAAGATSWERCCLGVPAIMLVLAKNQQQVAKGLEDAGAALIVGEGQPIADSIPRLLLRIAGNFNALQTMSQAAMQIVDGHGVGAVIKKMES
ncbi:UDP-2,4-diacetamido-2,4,6-trideoxy-beta-L-altropyranose hydrolase [Stutzerimonas balearica]|uniref:UDP-2,4-diacetamido-2,4, 6-trideoxy-beta-L-altropyranose hydrolase n=1 Tax=Stutzerimonas balearica TaxID=74829 RepID=UPI003F7581D8